MFCLVDIQADLLDIRGWPRPGVIPAGNELRPALDDTEEDPSPVVWWGFIKLRLLSAYPGWELVGARSDPTGLLLSVALDRHVDSQMGGDLVLCGSYTPPGDITRHLRSVLFILASKKKPSGERKFVLKTAAELGNETSARSLAYLRLLRFVFTDLQRRAVCGIWAL